MKTAQEYINDCTDAINSNPHMRKNTVQNWESICKDIGYGLGPYTNKEGDEAMKTFYGAGIVKPCLMSGKPIPIDNKKVIQCMNEGRKKARNYKNPLTKF